MTGTGYSPMSEESARRSDGSVGVKPQFDNLSFLYYSQRNLHCYKKQRTKKGPAGVLPFWHCKPHEVYYPVAS